MPIQVELNSELRLKTVVFTGRVTTPEFVEYGMSLAPVNMREYDVAFINLGAMTECEFGYDSVWPHANRASQRDTCRSRFIEVIFAPSDVGYGLARMYQSLVEEPIEVHLFRDEVESRAALTEALASFVSQQ